MFVSVPNFTKFSSTVCIGNNQTLLMQKKNLSVLPFSAATAEIWKKKDRREK